MSGYNFRKGQPSDRFDSLMAELQRTAPRPSFRIAGLVGLEPGFKRRPTITNPIGLSVAAVDLIAAPATFAFGCHGQDLRMRARGRGMLRGLSVMASNVKPVSACRASRPVKACQRRIATST